eukprot:scaffold56798_cov59-Phaeocystis_antarctica.AAC.6
MGISTAPVLQLALPHSRRVNDFSARAGAAPWRSPGPPGRPGCCLLPAASHLPPPALRCALSE